MFTGICPTFSLFFTWFDMVYFLFKLVYIQVDQVNYFGRVKVNLTDPYVDNLRSATTPCTSTMLPQINSMLAKGEKAKGHSILQTE